MYQASAASAPKDSRFRTTIGASGTATIQTQPVTAALARIRAVGALGDEPLPAVAARLAQQPLALVGAAVGRPAHDAVAEAQRLAQRRLALAQRVLAQVLAVEPQDVEDIEGDLDPAVVPAPLQRLEARPPAGQPDDLAVDDEAPGRRLLERGGHLRVALVERQPVARLECYGPTVAEGQAAIAVELALDDPVGCVEDVSAASVAFVASARRGIGSAMEHSYPKRTRDAAQLAWRRGRPSTAGHGTGVGGGPGAGPRTGVLGRGAQRGARPRRRHRPGVSHPRPRAPRRRGRDRPRGRSRAVRHRARVGQGPLRRRVAGASGARTDRRWRLAPLRVLRHAAQRALAHRRARRSRAARARRGAADDGVRRRRAHGCEGPGHPPPRRTLGRRGSAVTRSTSPATRTA